MKVFIAAIMLVFASVAGASAGPSYQADYVAVIKIGKAISTESGKIYEYTEAACIASEATARERYNRIAKILGVPFSENASRGAVKRSIVALSISGCRAVTG